MIRIQAMQGVPIKLGRLGENVCRGICFPELNGLLEMYPDADVTILNCRPTDPDAYPVNPEYIDIDDGEICWRVQSGDLAYDGKGQCEVIISKDPVISKSFIYDTEILEALDGSGDPPDPWTSWQQDVIENANRAEAAAELLENPGAEAVTLAPGTPASASYDNGTFTFGIPQGQQGRPGDPGAPGKDGDDYVITEDDYQEIADDVVKSQGLQRIVTEATDAADLARGYADGKHLDGSPNSQLSENNAEYFKNQAQQILSSVSTEGETQIAAIQAKGEETLESIPDDYTELSGDVSNLKSALSSRYTGLKLSIIGDSIDTFDQAGYKIDGYRMYYPALGVTDVNQTWWKHVIDNSGMQLEVNASWSGSRVTNTHSDPTYPDFYDRVDLIGSPDIIFVTLGSNDSTNNIALGDYDFDTTYTELSEETFRTAYIKGIKGLQATHSSAQIICITQQMKFHYKESVRVIAETLGCGYIDAGDYVASSGVHPGVLGMRQIASLVLYPTATKGGQAHYPADSEVVDNRITNVSDMLNVKTVNGSAIAWEYKKIQSSTGAITNNTARMKTLDPIPSWITDMTPVSNYQFGLFAFNGETYVGWWDGTKFSKSSVTWRTTALHIDSSIRENGYDLYIVLLRTNGENLSDSDQNGIVFNSLNVELGNVSGKANAAENKLRTLAVSADTLVWSHEAVSAPTGETFETNTRYLSGFDAQRGFVGLTATDGYQYSLFAYDASGEYIGCWTGNEWGTSAITWFDGRMIYGDDILANGYTIRVMFHRDDDANIAASELSNLSFDTTTSLARSVDNEMQELLDIGKKTDVIPINGSAFSWERKAISATNGTVSSSTNRIKMTNPIPDYIVKIVPDSDYWFMVYAFDSEDGTYMGWWNGSGWSKSSVAWFKSSLIIDEKILDGNYTMYLVMRKAADTEIVDSDKVHISFQSIANIAIDNERDLTYIDASSLTWEVGFIYSSNGQNQNDRPQAIRINNTALISYTNDVLLVCANPLITEIWAYKYNSSNTYVERIGGKVRQLILPTGYRYRLAMLSETNTVITSDTISQYTQNTALVSPLVGNILTKVVDMGETGDYVLTTESIRKPIKLELLGTIYRLQSFLMYNGKYYSTQGTRVSVQSADFALENDYELELGHGNAFQLGSGTNAYVSGWDDQTVYVLDLTDLSEIKGTIDLPTTGYTTAAIDDLNHIAYIFQRDTSTATPESYNFIVYDYQNEQIISTKKIHQPMAAMQAVDFVDGRIYVLNGGGETAKPNGYRCYDTNGTLLFEYVIGSRANKEPEGVFVDRATKVVYISYMDGNVYRIKPVD